MLILGIESSSLVASCALVRDETLVAEYTVDFKKTHSQTLLPMIDEIVRMVGISLEELDAIAVSGGPGSFTGLRIGSATAKGLGLALKKPLIHVPTLDAMAYVLYGTDRLICPIMDARRSQVYTGLYHFHDTFEVVKAGTTADIHELIEELNTRGEAVVFLGDGVPVNAEIIKTELQVPYSFALAHVNRQKASAVATLGMDYYRLGKIETAMEHEPDYLRKSQAERELDEARRQGRLEELSAGNCVEFS